MTAIPAASPTRSRDDLCRLRDNLAAIDGRIADACRRAGRVPGEVARLAVTKSVDAVTIGLLHDLGVRDMAESRPQTLWDKHAALPFDIRWHQIGHLQTNKVRRTLPLLTSLHALDRPSLLESLAAETDRLGRPLDVFLQLNLTGEDQKHGFAETDLDAAAARVAAAGNLNLVGLMAMARYSDDPEDARPVFRRLRGLRDRVRERFPECAGLSMGMSGDFEVAVEEGATHLRVGSALFEGVAGA